ncbi:hypothetical protein HD806DRAFT_549019 [Xylariaceae sp. AK1471]|nr:hypothetical protein HD806DRAFT_549019 [Xylariaceae sp. AK1471]
MDRSFDGHGLSRPQLQAKAEAAAYTGQLDGDSSNVNAGAVLPGTPRPDDLCDWRGDSPEPELDDLSHACNNKQQPSRPEDDAGESSQSNDQTKQPAQGDELAEEADSFPIPPPRKPTHPAIPENFSPPADGKTSNTRSNPELPIESLVEDGKRSEHGKIFKKKRARAASTAGPSNVPLTENGAENEPPTQDRSHSPWVDSLDQMPGTMQQKVNKGIKQALEAVTSILTPFARTQSHAPEPTVAEETTETSKTSGLAPETAVLPPSDFYIPRPIQNLPALPEQRTDNENSGDDKKQGKNRKKAEKRAKNEARHRARKEKNEEKKKVRREQKERRRKEKEWKKIEKKGGDIPQTLLQGLRITPGTKIPYDPRCDICTKSSVATLSSPKRNPKCTTCAKTAEREATSQYLKSSKINLVDLPSLDDLFDAIKKALGKRKKTTGGTPADYQGQIDEELVKHIALHVQDFASNGGEAALRGHTCNDQGQQGHLGRQGLDGNRDSPTMVDGGQMISSPYKHSSLSGMSTSSEVDWWVQALYSSDPSSTPCCPSSPYRAVTPLRRSKSTVYEPRPFRASTPNRNDIGQAVYHIYLPFAVCHSFPCSQSQPGGFHWSIPPFQQGSAPLSPQGHPLNQGVPMLSPGNAETIPADTPRPSQDGFFPRRSESL